VGSSDRSEIFYLTDEQRQIAEDTIAVVDAAGFWPGKVMTAVNEAGRFLEADAEDQDYFQRYPGSSQFPRPAPASAQASPD
jgi:peptide-methionine (S)-S-oxide reductase